MTLVEVIVAMMLLAGVLLGLGRFMVLFSQASNQAHLIINANEIAARRLDDVRNQNTYSAIDTLAGTTTMKADFLTYAETTKVVRIGGAPTDSLDYRLITVVVTHPSMRKIVRKTTAMAAF
jgi:type II secretory pathway pseudopilin PulG